MSARTDAMIRVRAAEPPEFQSYSFEADGKNIRGSKIQKAPNWKAAAVIGVSIAAVLIFSHFADNKVSEIV